MFRTTYRLTSRVISAFSDAACGSNSREHLRLCAAGMIQTALDLMDAWVSQCTEPGLKGVSSNKQPTPVPRWIDALLLLVNSCTATIWEASLQKEDATNKAPEPQARCLSQNMDQAVLMVCSRRIWSTMQQVTSPDAPNAVARRLTWVVMPAACSPAGGHSDDG